MGEEDLRREEVLYLKAKQLEKAGGGTQKALEIVEELIQRYP